MINEKKGKRSMKSYSANRSAFGISFFSTILIIIVFSVLILIAYRIESTLNIDPIVIFTLTDHLDGNFSFTFFNMKGDFSLKWLYQFGTYINQFQVAIPIKVRTFFQLISYSVDKGADIITTMFY